MKEKARLIIFLAYNYLFVLLVVSTLSIVLYTDIKENKSTE